MQYPLHTVLRSRAAAVVLPQDEGGEKSPAFPSRGSQQQRPHQWLCDPAVPAPHVEAMATLGNNTTQEAADPSMKKLVANGKVHTCIYAYN